MGSLLLPFRLFLSPSLASPSCILALVMLLLVAAAAPLPLLLPSPPPTPPPLYTHSPADANGAAAAFGLAHPFCSCSRAAIRQPTALSLSHHPNKTAILVRLARRLYAFVYCTDVRLCACVCMCECVCVRRCSRLPACLNE